MDLAPILTRLPTEISDIIRSKSTSDCLDFLSTHLLRTDQTDSLSPILEPLLPDLVARWLPSQQIYEVIAAFGRIVPFQSHLSQYAYSYLDRHQLGRDIWTSWTETSLLELLLGLYRLAMADLDTLSMAFQPVDLMFGINHDSRPVRYLTIRLICIYLHAADAASQEMIQKYLNEGPILGPWGTKQIDYRFFGLWESERYKTLKSRLDHQLDESMAEDLSARLVSSHELRQAIVVADKIVPKPERHSKAPAVAGSSIGPSFVETPTAKTNMNNFISALLKDDPVLLHGRSGSGKTIMVNHLANKLDKLDTMITLHLNEQSDAKTLLGLYTSSNTPGKFVWKSGVLTTAVREGRWVLVEDLDRAPNEIISTLLPLIERRELSLPSRGETIKAAPGFKLIATIRTSERHGRGISDKNILGLRFWNVVSVSPPSMEELCSMVSTKFPSLSPHTQTLVQIYQEILEFTQTRLYATQSQTASSRPISPRDLFKWCRRINSLFQDGRRFTEDDYDVMFLEATDCFAGHLYNDRSFEDITSLIAQKLHIDPQRRDHLLRVRHITLKTNEASHLVQIGRSTLCLTVDARKRTKFSKTFSINAHTLRLMERIGSAVKNLEPLLLVGETGTGKTTCVQQLAKLMGKRLVPFNLSQQSESSDLLGGFKPVNLRVIAMGIQEEFEQLFVISFSQKENLQYLELLSKCIAKSQWKGACKLWVGAIAEVQKRIKASIIEKDGLELRENKRQKVEPESHSITRGLSNSHVRSRWQKLSEDIRNLESRLASSPNAVAFSFVEGSIVKAVKNGDWVLLDEINLATPDTLEALFDLLQGAEDGGSASLLLTESGKTERIVAHPDFRVFAAMNPATDVGKADLPSGIRSRFTEIYVESPDRDLQSLQHIIQTYLGNNIIDKSIVAQVAKLYVKAQELVESNTLVDGVGQKPHFSLRTLTRCLTFANDIAPLCGLRRGLYEGFNMSFMTYLDQASEKVMDPLIIEHIFGKKTNSRTELQKSLKKPVDGRDYIQYQKFWLRQGTEPPEDQIHYIITPFVQRNLDHLIRAMFSRRYPILIQGPTSSGKTSMIEYLAKLSGHQFFRVNNHEHTDLQEYLGSYVSDANGQLRFQEGILVEALRNGYWIVLDELNLAPSDILEALNRLLDDNRELFIPETQESIKPHEDFMLFATQNPAGLYGGRKPLSRAFRNRFLELHFDDIPVDELCEILQRRTQIPESWSRRIVEVYKELSSLRQETRIFEQHSFATLRDLFRWALRKAETIEDLAVNGFLLLAERVRKPDEQQKIKEVIENVLSLRGPKVRIVEEKLYSSEQSLEIRLYQSAVPSSQVVWTKSMRRLFVLVSHALRNNEPVLLVGDTGCGKTTVCQMLADAFNKQLHIVNAHQNTETGDLIGLQRPVRNRSGIEQQLRTILLEVLMTPVDNILTHGTEELLRLYDQSEISTSNDLSTPVREKIHSLRSRFSALFEWTDGSLVSAMKTGQFFLLDEISLADDSVLERLNSVLEPSRTIFLAEKGPIDSLVSATDEFQFFATMNPGGDYGKRELSPALRNRFTEIWVPSILDLQDIQDIVEAKLGQELHQLAGPLVQFANWFTTAYKNSATSAISVRDVLACIDFINSVTNPNSIERLFHGLAMVYIDTLGANPAGLISIDTSSLDNERQKCVKSIESFTHTSLAEEYLSNPSVHVNSDTFQIGKFSLDRTSSASEDNSFTFLAPTTRMNAMRIVRAMQLIKPILIEGDPGVGKTTLVSTLAKIVGKDLVRVNLSEQTDLMDLFGFDAPVEGAQAGQFAWRDAPFLKAMKAGDWVLLDEMNLASQSVLEGLNACLDHRGEVYIAELNQTFQRHPNFRLFAAQNPHHQGGGRKGLPASFVNRFTVVYADAFKEEDLHIICKQMYPSVDQQMIMKLTSFVVRLDLAVRKSHIIGASGSPWEINLRDALRWLQLSGPNAGLLPAVTEYDLSDLIFRRRFRSDQDKTGVDKLFLDNFDSEISLPHVFHTSTPENYQVGLAYIERALDRPTFSKPAITLPLSHVPVLEGMMVCVKQQWPVVLVGEAGSGKTTLINHLAAISGNELVTLSINADTDATDLVGGFEQLDPTRPFQNIKTKLVKYFRFLATDAIDSADISLASGALRCLVNIFKSPSAAQIFENNLIQQFLVEGLPTQHENTAKSLIGDIQALKSTNESTDAARFEWVDGILVRALENGDWLVLDNANLCSASVLDRLNSLLEPHGVLSVNENPLPNGETRTIKPHDNFRIFLTMDPRNGELSNAMRNRSLEIYVPPLLQTGFGHNNAVSVTDSLVYRFSNVMDSVSSLSSKDITEPFDISVSLDHVSVLDHHLLRPFVDQIASGLIPSVNPEIISLLETQSDPATGMYRLSSELVTRSTALLDSKVVPRGLMTIHPLNNFSLLPPGKNDQRHLLQLGEIITISELYHQLSYGLKLISLPKIQEYIIQATKEIQFKLEQSLKLDLVDMYEDSHIFCEKLYWHLSFLKHSHDVSTNEALLLSMKMDMVSTFVTDAVVTHQIHAGSNQLEILQRYHNPDSANSGQLLHELWAECKPPLPSTPQTVGYRWELNALADKFDRLRQRRLIPLKDVVTLTSAFRQVLTSLDVGIDDVHFETLAGEIQATLQTITIDDNSSIEPRSSTFVTEFRRLYELFILHTSLEGSKQYMISPLFDQIAVFTEEPTRSYLPPSTRNSTARYTTLRNIATYAFGSTSDPETLSHNSISESIALKLTKSHQIQLRDLDHFKMELELMGQALSKGAGKLADLEVHCLAQQSTELYTFLVNIENTTSSRRKATFPSSLQQCFQNLRSIESRAEETKEILAVEWVSLGLTFLQCYVPSRPNDPLLKRFLEQDLISFQFKELSTQIASLELVGSAFAEKSKTIRSKLVEDRLVLFEKVEEPQRDILKIRPDSEKFRMLQREFKHVLDISGTLMQRLADNQPMNDAVMIQNIKQVHQRLSTNYQGLEDIIEPLIGFLGILVIGLSLMNRSSSQNGVALNHIQHPLRLVLFHTKDDQLISAQKTPMLVKKVDQLVLKRLVGDAEHDRLITYAHRIFLELYGRWKLQLEKAQKENVANSSLYTFQGHQDDDEAAMEKEFSELFPDDQEATAPTQPIFEQNFTRDLSIKISTLHELLIKGNSGLQIDSIVDIRSRMKDLLLASHEYLDPHSVTSSLPATLLHIDSNLSALNYSEKPNMEFYNFYTDMNLQEARKMMNLVNRVRDRFENLAKSWPEHATPADVLRICSEIMEFRHVEPVVKFLSKSEKLHETVYQWQKVASKEYSAADVYDDLTKLLVGWRKLELSTWARLLAFEIHKCLDNARSWWFIAYETIIHVPTQLSLSDELTQSHTEKTIRTIQTFLATTSLGEFSARLDLLQVFVLDLKRGDQTSASSNGMQSALASLIAYYDRYRSSVEKLIIKERAKLEKDLKEVILLASWKDVNIDALRESAKRSHHKLFKIVRKFRKMLQQPMSVVLQNGTPEFAKNMDQTTAVSSLSLVQQAGDQTSSLCSSIFQDWLDVKARFRNIEATSRLMSSICSNLSPTVDGTTILLEILGSLDKSISTLQKETPQTLTDENKELVKHLKVRKRTLFADILKELRHMGFQYNLPFTVLEKQDDTCKIIYNLPYLGKKDSKSQLAAANNYFCAMLDVMPKIRDISREHSGDLTPAEVTRSIGYLEGILNRLLNQRKLLARSRAANDLITAGLKSITALCDPSLESVQLDHGGIRHHLEIYLQIVTELSPTCRLFADIVKAKSSLANEDHAGIVSGLERAANAFDSTQSKLLSALEFPKAFFPAIQQNFIDECRLEMDEFKLKLAEWCTSDETIGEILTQLLPFCGVPPSHTNGLANTTNISLEEFRGRLFQRVDTMLAIVQNLESNAKPALTSSEEQSWLIKEDSIRAMSLQHLSKTNVSEELNGCLNDLSKVPQEQLSSAIVLLRHIQPVVQTYAAIITDDLVAYTRLHCASSKFGYQLSCTFIKIGTDGFCTPPDKSTGEEGGGTEKLEGGTGLGEGEGAENISNDIEEDEDLTELAETKNGKDDREDLGEDQDAVDMADADLEGQTEEVEDREEQDKDGEGEVDEKEEEIDEETGDVDDLGPSAVDEKMWDSGEAAEKDKKADTGKGDKSEEMAEAGADGENDDAGSVEEDQPTDEPDDVAQEGMEKADDHLKETENLDLPEDMNIDNQSEAESLGSAMDDMTDDFDDLDNAEGDQRKDFDDGEAMSLDGDSEKGSDADGDGNEDDKEADKEADTGSVEDDRGELADKTEADAGSEEPVDSEADPDEAPLPLTADNEAGKTEDAVESDDRGGGQDANEDSSKEQGQGLESNEPSGEQKSTPDANAGAAEVADGDEGEDERDQNGMGRSQQQNAPEQNQSFKKLGDVLNKWLRQNRPIQLPPDEPQKQDTHEDVDMANADVDFEHMQDDDQEADTQALGTATQEQAKGVDLDNSDAQNNQENEHDQFYEDVIEQHDEEELTANAMEIDGPVEDKAQSRSFINNEERRREIMETAPGLNDDEASDNEDGPLDITRMSINEENVDDLPSLEVSRALWHKHESSTRVLSAMLAEQLRLILAPTLATKLRGDFRTGKRLNIKRIIPYIASSYKRDKIWMRRSVPSKRSYQIMIALDDSQSMADDKETAELSKVHLAHQTIALIAKSLSVLETGDLSIVSFGEDLRIAHPFGKPFSDDAGAHIFQNFGFNQEKTDVKEMLRKGIDMFREARRLNHGSSAQLWQLLLIVSDGICQDHDYIVRQVREAENERIMIVFVIVDKVGQGSTNRSIMDLQTADFKADGGGVMKLHRKVYMDTFPFRWWLVVRDVRELPVVLSTALRQWFAETADVGR